MSLDYKNKNDKFLILKLCLIWTFVFGVCTHGFALLNLHYAHDSLALVTERWECSWSIMLGRPFFPIYKFFVGNIPAIWLVGVLSFVYISLASFFICDIFDIQEQCSVILLTGLLTANSTMIVLCATYITGMDVFMFAMLFAVCSAWCTVKIKKIWASVILSVFCLTISLTTYQAYFAVFLTIGLLYIFYRLLSRDYENECCLLCLLKKAVVVVALSLCLYKIISSISLRIINNNLSSYLDWSAVTDIKTVIPFFFKTYKSFFMTYTHVALHRNISVFIHILFLIYILIELFSHVYERVKRRKCQDIVVGVIECILFVLIPFVVNLMFFITRGKNSYELTKFSFYLVYVLVLVFRPRKNSLAKNIVCVLCFIVVFFNIVTANQVYTKRKLVYDSTKAQMTRLLAMMSMEEGYVEGETPVVLVGHLDRNPQFHNYKEFDNISIYTAQKQDSSITYPGSGVNFFRYVLNTKIPFVNDKEGDVEQAAEAVNSMSVFPNKGCCRMIDGKMFVKLSDEEIPVFKLAELPDYSIVQDEVSFWVDEDINKDRSRFIRGWAYHENDICKVLIEVDGKYYAADQETRPDVQKTFTLNNDKMGFSVTIPNGAKQCSLYLVNEDKKEIYITKVAK